MTTNLKEILRSKANRETYEQLLKYGHTEEEALKLIKEWFCNDNYNRAMKPLK